MLAYTLQRIERYSGGQWVLDPLDQTHIVNFVTFIAFRPDYILGFRFHYNTGRLCSRTVDGSMVITSSTRGLTCCGLKIPIRWISTSTSSTSPTKVSSSHQAKSRLNMSYPPSAPTAHSERVASGLNTRAPAHCRPRPARLHRRTHGHRRQSVWTRSRSRMSHRPHLERSCRAQ